MAPTTTSLSPAELSYLHESLSQSPPIRPDGRSPTQFRPLVAEIDILPNAYGSSRVRFSDGTEAIVGVKAEVERSNVITTQRMDEGLMGDQRAVDDEDGEGATDKLRAKGAKDRWVELVVEVPGYREDDTLPVFLGQMLSEALLSGGSLKQRLWINSRFHWKLYIDILLMSPPTSYPLPLLSLTTHLALLSTRLPRLVSEGDEDPLFDDDWEASTYLYPFREGTTTARADKPPVTLLVAMVGENMLFDPSKEEVACADGVLAMSAGEIPVTIKTGGTAAEGGVMLGIEKTGPRLKLLSVRMIDPPSRLTPLGIPKSANPGADLAVQTSSLAYLAGREGTVMDGVWTPPRGGVRRDMIARVVKSVIEPGGVAQEVMDGLEEFALA